MAEQPLLLGLELTRVVLLELDLLLPALHHFIGNTRPVYTSSKSQTLCKKMSGPFVNVFNKINVIELIACQA